MAKAENVEHLIKAMLVELLEKEAVHNNLLHFFTEQIEAIVIRSVLEKTNGNQSRTAKILGISRSTLRYKTKKLI